MPYSSEMPALVFPDTEEGHRLAYLNTANEPEVRDNIYFCLEFEPQWDNPNRCRNANSAGVMQKNLCFRCPCGYMFMDMDEKDYKNGYIGVNLNGIR